MTLPPPALFTADDAEQASDEWGANCGPGALAAVLGKTLDEVRPHLLDFEQKRYTHPTLMFQILNGLKVRYTYKAGNLGRWDWPAFGLVRVQWEGPWMDPGVQIAVRYRRTHWVGAHTTPLGSAKIFDINAISVGGWIDVQTWMTSLVPWLLEECVPRANGNWYITHRIDIKRR